jgi:hypothetical protein
MIPARAALSALANDSATPLAGLSDATAKACTAISAETTSQFE